MDSLLDALDASLYRRIRGLATDPEQVDAVRRFSAIGEHGAVWLAIGAAGWLVDGARRDRWRRSTLCVAGAYCVSTTVKLLVRRKRPVIEELPALTGTPTQLSFPSSHATTSFAAARAYGTLVPSVPLYSLAVPLVLSRLYLGVHFPSDIVAGAALGTAIGSLGR